MKLLEQMSITTDEYTKLSKMIRSEHRQLLNHLSGNKNPYYEAMSN